MGTLRTTCDRSMAFCIETDPCHCTFRASFFRTPMSRNLHFRSNNCEDWFNHWFGALPGASLWTRRSVACLSALKPLISHLEVHTRAKICIGTISSMKREEKIPSSSDWLIRLLRSPSPSLAHHCHLVEAEPRDVRKMSKHSRRNSETALGWSAARTRELSS